MDRATCECWFLDVGQGSSSVILLGERRAIVIDAGPRGARSPLDLLNRYVDTIEALIISHNHEDHDGNVAEILSAFRNKIQNIFFLQDRSDLYIRTLAVLQRFQHIGFPSPQRVEASGSRPSLLFSEGTSGDLIEVSVLYPDMLSNLRSQKMGETGKNLTSAIIRMKCGGRKIIFSGDSTVDSWENIAQRMPSLIPIECDAMTIPHHGGKLIQNDADDEAEVYSRLFNNIVKPEFAIVSVGTNNSYRHPSPEVIRALVKSGAKVLCTQITQQCCSDLEAIRRTSRTFTQPSDSQRGWDVSKSGKSRRVACFGSVVLAIGREKLSLSPHIFSNIEKLRRVEGFSPLCGN